jgi:hypothetical protein
VGHWCFDSETYLLKQLFCVISYILFVCSAKLCYCTFYFSIHLNAEIIYRAFLIDFIIISDVDMYHNENAKQKSRINAAGC